MENKNFYALSEVSKLFRHWGRYERAEAFAPQTIEGYDAVLQRMIGWIGDKDVREITLVDLLSVKKLLIDRGCKEGYIYKQLTVMKTFFRFIKKSLKVETLDPDEIEVPRQRRHDVEYLNPQEVRKFLTAIETHTMCGVRQMAIVVTLLETGMRIGECLSLNRDSIVLENGKKLHEIRDIKEANKGTAVIIGKGSKKRMIFFKTWSLWWIVQYLSRRTDDCGALFITHASSGRKYKATRFTPEDCRRFFRIYSKKENMRTVTPHMMRRTAATAFRFNGGDTRDIQGFLGHTNLNITERYLGVDNNQLQQAHGEYMHYGGIEKYGDEKVRIEIKWARDAGYSKCRECETTERRHAGHGYCDICYIRSLRAGTLEKKPKKQKAIVKEPMLIRKPIITPQELVPLNSEHANVRVLAT